MEVTDTFAIHAEEKLRLSNDKTYQLYGMIVHTGPSAYIGHYFCYFQQNSQWYKIYDTSAQIINEKKVLAAKAYLLFYNKQLCPVSNHQVVPLKHSKQPIPGLTPMFSK